MIVADFADFCLVTSLLVADLWDALPPDLKPRGPQAKGSNSEQLTMVLVEECMGWAEETVAISPWKQHRDLFPHIPHRTRFNRRRRARTDALLVIRQRVLALLDAAEDRYCVIDSLPVPVISFHLVPGAASSTGRSTRSARAVASMLPSGRPPTANPLPYPTKTSGWAGKRQRTKTCWAMSSGRTVRLK